MANGREYFERRIEEEFARKNEQKNAPRVQREAPRARTFEPEWVDVAPGTPPPFEVETAPEANTHTRQTVNPEAAAALFGALLGGNVQDFPQQLLRAVSPNQQSGPSQLPSAPEHRGLPAGGGEPASQMPPEDEATVVDTRRRRRPHLPEGLKGYARRHKVVAGLAIASFGVTGGLGSYRVLTGGTMAEAVSTVTNGVVGVAGDTPKIALPALDCEKQLTSAEVDGSADMLMKMNAALVTDIEKAKKDKKFKLPTKSEPLPKMELPAIAFPESPEEIEKAKTLAPVPRYPKVVIRNEVAFAGCDKDKSAFRQEGNTVIVDQSKIGLLPFMLKPDEEGAPENARERYEMVPMLEVTGKGNKYAPVPGELDRLKASLTGKAGVEALQAEWRGVVYDSINNNDCKIPLRTESFKAIEKLITTTAKEQGVSNIKVVPEHDFIMPGEAFRDGKATALIDNKYVEIQNPQINCTNVKLVGGAS